MESEKYENDRLHIKTSYPLNNKGTSDNNRGQLVAAYELGLAGLRQYFNQLKPQQRAKLITNISENIKNIN